MKQKSARCSLYAILTLLLCLQVLFSIGSNCLTERVEASTAKVAFASSLQSSVKKAAKKAGASEDAAIGVANVKNYIGVHASRSSDSSTKGYLYRGSAAYVIKTKGSWSYVSSGSGLKGWVKSKYIATGSKAKTLTKKINPRVATVTSTDLNVRSSKSTKSDSNILLALDRGEQVIVLGVGSEWVKVRVSTDITGYVYRQYTDIEKGYAPGATASREKKMEELREKQEEMLEVAANSSKGESEKSGEWVSLGTFKITAYCPCARCNGKKNAGKTASGVKPKVDHTIAVDKSVISLGSRIRIGESDIVYVAEDTGVKGNTIDVFCATHSAAQKFGVKKKEIYLYKG